MNSFIKGLFGDMGGGILAGVLALVIVIALIVFLVWALKILLEATSKVGRGNNKRLSVTESLTINQKHQLVLVKRDNIEHLLLLGGTNELVVESNISAKQAHLLEKKSPPSKAQKEMSNLGKKINQKLAKTNDIKAPKIKTNENSSNADLANVSLRHTGLLRRSKNDTSTINPQTFKEKSQIQRRRSSDSDIGNAD